MKTLSVTKELHEGAWVIIAIVRYSNNSHVKRIYNNKGVLIDAIPIKDISNTNNPIS
jgi:hypothetical protein